MLLFLAAEAAEDAAKAPVWTYWISWALAIPAVLLVVAIIIGYLMVVQRKKYPH